MALRNFITGLCVIFAGASVLAPAEASAAGDAATMTVPVGAAKMDVTPDYPIRLTGYASRQTESEGVAQRLWAKALAIGSDEGDGPAVLITVDNCGVPDNVTREVASALSQKAGIRPERLQLEWISEVCH